MLKVIVTAVLIALANGCLEFILEGGDDSVTIGRSMEFTETFKTSIVTQPTGVVHTATVPDQCGSKKMVYSNFHRLIMAKPQDPVTGVPIESMSFDGMNDAGVSVSALYLPGYSKFVDAESLPPAQCGNAISQMQVPEYILSRYAKVVDLVAEIEQGKFPVVWGQVLMDEVQPVHWSITDASKNYVVLEYTVDRGRRMFKNTIHVMTNSPNYDWHMLNLNNYVHLSKYRRGDITYDGKEKLKPFGEGSGLLGVPGDFTPPSRFIRAVAMVQFSDTQNTSADSINRAFHILNAADITKGVIAENETSKRSDYTFWVLVKDLTNGCFYYRGYNYISIRRICFSEIPTYVSYITLDDDFLNGVEDVAGKLLPVRDEL